MQGLSEISTLEEAALHKKVQQALATLSKREREVLTRFYLQEQSPDRICSEMALSQHEFRLLKSRAKARFWSLGMGRARDKQSQGPRDVQVFSSPLNVGQILPIIAHAVAVFGDEKKASHWLETPLPLLGDRSPSETLETPEGITLVEQVLTRIEHNIPS
jgi:hypothetical protein